MKVVYDENDICKIVSLYVSAGRAGFTGQAGRVRLIVRDDDGLAMTDDCHLSVEVDLGDIESQPGSGSAASGPPRAS